jgi:peptide chain release factor 2
MVKDHRTAHETGNVSSVMDGDLDGFIAAYLTKKIVKGSNQPTAVSDQGDDL